ncbi:IS200/IS605 family transposase [Halorubrum tebenquichense]|uniref:IS200-type transposase (TCE31) n=1 Tax=Halorubrum tebenquichense DSM 14210 TaxID=1227485 RepID=M0DCP4_9EURY|nr:IS200/IS605 family transposase [Halorubrum tebenquichense]ELZ33255.1 IS200-type transposase (TCE31) [Halorubrum tebenquichense DSM 14210]
MPRGFDRERTNIHKLQYHFVWCPKYRKSVLKGEVRHRLEELIEDKANELDVEILELAIRPDHVHLFITGDPTLAPNKIMQQVKGYSSHHLREKYDFGLPSLWTRSYFVSSGGDVSSEVIEEYIDAQAGE